MDCTMFFDLRPIHMLRNRQVFICHIIQLYDFLLVRPSMCARLVLRVALITNPKRPFHVQSRTLPADHATCSAHNATEESVTNQLAQDRADSWGASGKDPDLDFDECPHTCCRDANWEELVYAWP
jgi:hypothetical protein